MTDRKTIYHITVDAERSAAVWSDIVVTYVCASFGGAAKFKELAEKKKKQVINLY